MDRQFEQTYHSLEADHWWFQARRAMLHALFERLDIPHHARVLDIGCASGSFLAELQQRGYRQLTGLDISPPAIARCRERGFTDVHVMDGARPAWPAESFDVIVASDVLEHLADDRQALENWLALLAPGGCLLVFVPAFRGLWSEHDVVNHHFRRYTRRELVDKGAAAGAQVQRSGYWNLALLPAVAAVRWTLRLLARLRGRPVLRLPVDGTGRVTVPNVATPPTDVASNDAVGREPRQRPIPRQLSQTPRWINALLCGWLSLENRWIAGGGFTFAGVSAFAVFRKPALPTLLAGGSNAAMSRSRTPVSTPPEVRR